MSDQIRQECWEKATHCLATSYVFQQKAINYEKNLRINSMFGIIIPLAIGAIATTYGNNSNYLKTALFISSPFLVIQAILSGISLINKWDHNLSYSLESQTANRILADKFKNLAKYPPSDELELKQKFDILTTEDNERTKQDEKIKFSIRENRKGLRYALMILRINCTICNSTPQNMEPTQCTNCGKF
ncbi:mobilome CxxCx(11)CxxC protein [Chryseobacterium arthrosphaerae]|uniref:mobilome CxxCx(11)CxxC protein n=1 Tax=Chryseobacterium arthrosphaerae TaxID=651561 RepID=UPI001F4B207A|nr:mobilome CxxCx(11)CxxC protein [Chryseobacterium arthrosphaerae]